MTPARTDWALWTLTRLFLLAIIAGWVPWPEQVNDLRIYGGWAAADLAVGRFPDDQMWQYPPLAGVVFLLGWLLPGDLLGYAVLFLAFDAAVMALAGAQAGRTGRGAGRRLWALVPLITGPLLLARFDVVPTTLAVAAVAASGRPLISGALAGIGAWLKVWPVLVLAGLRRRDLPAAALAVLLVSLALASAALLSVEDPFGFLAEQSARGLQIESVAAWPFLVWRAVGGPVEVIYQYGAHEVVGPAVPAAASASVLLTLALLAVVAVQRLRGAIEGLVAADVALAAVLFSVVTSRVFSGQYFVWLLGLGTLCLGDPDSRMRRVTWLLLGAGAATHLVYPWLYSALLDGSVLAVTVHTARIALTVAASALALVVLLRGARATPDTDGAPTLG